VKLTDLIKPEHVIVAFQKTDQLTDAQMLDHVDAHIQELLALSRAVSLYSHGRDFTVTMTAISIIDLAIQEATANKNIV
jgi:translation elongation factor EF-Tu-like GTPase